MFKKIILIAFMGFLLWKFFTEAQFHFTGFKSSAPSLPKATSALHCKKYFDANAFDKAASCYKKALSGDKINPELHFFLAASYYMNKDFQGAEFHTNFILKNFPKSRFARPSKLINKVAVEAERQKTILENGSANYLAELQNPGHWVKTPIKVWIEHSDNNSNLRNAFYTWQSALYPVVSFEMVNSKSKADIIVVFEDATGACSSIDAVGCTQTWRLRDNPKIIPKAKITLSYFSKTGVRLSDSTLYGILVHEIGHALGLSGHSSNQNDIMYPTTDNYNTRPTRRDINTLKLLYK